MSKPDRFLIFRTGQLGDMLATLPAIWAIRRQWPNAKLTLLCDAPIKSNYVGGPEIFRGSGLIDRFEHYEVADENSSPIATALRRLMLLMRLRRRGYTALFYLAASIRPRERVERDRRFFRAAGIRKFYGMDYFPPVPYASSVRPMVMAGHEADLLLARLKHDGVDVPARGEGSLDLMLGPTEEKEVADWIRAQGSDGGKTWIGIGPGSKMPAKRWDVGRFAEVARRLIEDFDVWPVVLGGGEDGEIARGLTGGWGRGFNAAGELSVRGAALALGKCVLFLGNDSGAMHLAAAAGTPCVAIFSSRDWPGAWYPYGVEQRVFRSEIECEGCYLVECIERQNECLRRISADDVYAACANLLSGKTAHARAEIAP